MKVAISLILVLGSAMLLTYGGDLPPSTSLAVGLLILGGWLAGLLCKKVNIPAITGYLVFGGLIGPHAMGLITLQQVDHDLLFAGDLAIALIALTAGGEIQLTSLKGNIRRILILLAVHMIVLMLAVAGLVLAAKPFVPFLADETWLTVVVVAMLASVIMVAKSPAVTVAMIADYRAAGPLSQTTLIITVFKDLILIVLFATALALSKGLLTKGSEFSGLFLVSIAVQLIGSLALGALFGLLMAWYVRKVQAHLILFIIGSCMFIALLGEQQVEIFDLHFHLEPLLMALAAGLLLRNAWPRRTEGLFETVESMSLPIYCLFFAIVGARIDLNVFGALWYLSLTLVIVRLLFTWLGIHWGLKLGRFEGKWPRYLWLGMISQAGVSLVLITLVRDTFIAEPWAKPFKSVLVGAIFINQLIGPLLFRRGLYRSGEAHAARRHIPKVTSHA